VGFFAFALTATVRAHRATPSIGVHTLLGASGIARTDLSPRGIVLVQSEEWSAEALDGPIKKGEKIQVVEVSEGVYLRVIKALL
jgi:membrane-bound ClpP family serine protease